MLLITVSGRKSGKKYTLPVSYYRENGNLWVLTSRDCTWWRNLQGSADVSLLLRRQPVNAFAEPQLEPHPVELLPGIFVLIRKYSLTACSGSLPGR